jgi:GDP-4-dehydro-6-deoxy-D-mannose reductase
MERILVTGANGFCARHLILRLTARGQTRVHGADIHAGPAKGLVLNSYTSLDVSNQTQVEALIDSLRPDRIFHLAGRHQGTPIEIYRVNFMGSVHLLEAVRHRAPQARVLMVGSAAEYGHVPPAAMPVLESFPCRPLSPYGISKYAVTLTTRDYADRHGIKVITARPFNIVGAGLPGDLMVGAVLGRIKAASTSGCEPLCIPVGNLGTERDFVAVEDVVEAYTAMLETQSWGDVFNLCSGEPRTVQSVLETLVSHSTRTVHWRVDPQLVRSADVPCLFGSFDKARAVFGFAPKRPLEAALASAWKAAMALEESCD